MVKTLEILPNIIYENFYALIGHFCHFYYALFVVMSIHKKQKHLHSTNLKLFITFLFFIIKFM